MKQLKKLFKFYGTALGTSIINFVLFTLILGATWFFTKSEKIGDLFLAIAIATMSFFVVLETVQEQRKQYAVMNKKIGEIKNLVKPWSKKKSP